MLQNEDHLKRSPRCCLRPPPSEKKPRHGESWFTCDYLRWILSFTIHGSKHKTYVGWSSTKSLFNTLQFCIPISAISMVASLEGSCRFELFTWRIIRVSMWLTMVGKSTNWGYSPSKWRKWLINGVSTYKSWDDHPSSCWSRAYGLWLKVIYFSKINITWSIQQNVGCSSGWFSWSYVCSNTSCLWSCGY